MASSAKVYKLIETHSSTELRFVFFSRGKSIITKLVIYTYTHQFEGKEVYNLGFGDYNYENNDIDDQVKTNNGDAYRVFNTVLSTVPLFFATYPNAVLLIQGSDSTSTFADECKRSCNKGCQSICRKLHQRVSIYRNFIEKYFTALSSEYWFLGGYVEGSNHMLREHYIPGREYDAILVFKK